LGSALITSYGLSRRASPFSRRDSVALTGQAREAWVRLVVGAPASCQRPNPASTRSHRPPAATRVGGGPPRSYRPEQSERTTMVTASNSRATNFKSAATSAHPNHGRSETMPAALATKQHPFLRLHRSPHRSMSAAGGLQSASQTRLVWPDFRPTVGTLVTQGTTTAPADEDCPCWCPPNSVRTTRE
jgi:hypothetical protein